MWKSLPELRRILYSLEYLPDLEQLWSLAHIWKRTIKPISYLADSELSTLIKLTKAGEKAYQAIKDTPNTTDHDALLAIFTIFAYDEILIDCEKTDFAALCEILQKELLTGKLFLAPKFGRKLYDKFNQLIPNGRVDHLFANAVEDLIEGIPIGSFQVGHILVGPLGIVIVSESRYIPPTLALPLWHCSDTGCRHLHNVNFLPPKIPYTIAYQEAREFLRDNYGPTSPWDDVICKLDRSNKWPIGRPYVDLFALVAESIVGEERTRLLVDALKSDHKDHLRQILINLPKRGKEFQTSATAIAAKLTEEEQFQILMTLEDNDLVTLIDIATLNKRIYVPIGEIRTSKQKVVKRPNDVDTELSSLGLRTQIKNPQGYLISTILAAYETEGLRNELDWRSGKDDTVDTRQALADFLRNKGPKIAIETLILSSQIITSRVASSVVASLPELKNQGNASNYLLWKFGFDPLQFDDSLNIYSERLRIFKETLLRLNPIDSEMKRSEIRSAGVNLFVSVEEWLSQLIEYNAWLLSTDHFMQSFVFDSLKASLSVPHTVGSYLDSASDETPWSTSGHNTLGTLLRYLDAAVKWMDCLPNLDSSRYVRPDHEFPFYALGSIAFPFRHIQLWADADYKKLQEYVNDLKSIVRIINQAQLAKVRNGIDHHRIPGEFPELNDMITCSTLLEEAVQRADVQRYIPKKWWLDDFSKNRDGTVKLNFVDHQGRKLVIYGPPLVLNLPAPKFDIPYIIAPGNLLGQPNSQLIFAIEPNSIYSEYWSDYPKRRAMTAGIQQIPDKEVTTKDQD